MWAKVTSIGLKGMEGYRVNVEVGTFVGMDSFKIVGLPDASVRESRERIGAALRTLGYILSGQRVTINLSPADQKKFGPMFDFAMAIGLLISLHELEVPVPESTAFIGALSLDGSVQPVLGMLPAVLAARRLGIKRIYMPFDETLPFLEFKGLEIIYVVSLQDAIDHLSGKRSLSGGKRELHKEDLPIHYGDFKSIIGHGEHKHTLEVAAAGEHHVLMTGPPGCGKSLLAECFISILPPLSEESFLEVISLYQLGFQSLPFHRSVPFRSPHHSASGISIIGGGQYPRPGEISLAHRGVLFLDEIGEFSKKTLDMLRQPLESGYITISRTQATITYPASFILIGAMNPCPCGYAGSNSHYCTCTNKQIMAYQNKLSGPLRDRFDINLDLKPVNFEKELRVPGREEESSEVIRIRVEEARYRQYERYGREICNGRVPYEELIDRSAISESQKVALQQLAIEYNWSNRTQIKIIRIARTISDLKCIKHISDQSLREAVKLNSGVVTLVSSVVSGTNVDNYINVDNSVDVSISTTVSN